MNDLSRISIFLMSMMAVNLSGCRPQKSLSERTAQIHDRVLTVDTHIDWPIQQFLNPDFEPSVKHTLDRSDGGQWDLVRMKEGGLDAVFMSIFTPQKERTEQGHTQAKEIALKQIELTKKMVVDNSDTAAIALTPEDAYRLEEAGKRAIFMGMENGYPIARNLDNLTLTRLKRRVILLSSPVISTNEQCSPFNRIHEVAP